MPFEIIKDLSKWFISTELEIQHEHLVQWFTGSYGTPVEIFSKTFGPKTSADLYLKKR